MTSQMAYWVNDLMTRNGNVILSDNSEPPAKKSRSLSNGSLLLFADLYRSVAYDYRQSTLSAAPTHVHRTLEIISAEDQYYIYHLPRIKRFHVIYLDQNLD
jgi:hypothetical protein